MKNLSNLQVTASDSAILLSGWWNKAGKRPTGFAMSQHWKELVLGDEAIRLHFRLQVVPLCNTLLSQVYMALLFTCLVDLWWEILQRTCAIAAMTYL